MTKLNTVLGFLLVTVLYLGANSSNDVQARVPTCTEEACEANNCDEIEDEICIMVWCGEEEGWVQCWKSF